MKRVRIQALVAVAGVAALGACATLEEAATEIVADTYHATLTGAQEVGGGDPDGAGDVEISVANRLDQVCWDIKNVRNIGNVTAAHIHYGQPGTNGPPVFTLDKNNEGTWKGCKSGTEWTEHRIKDDPTDFYVNVHTTEYPNGAIRGQLGHH